MPVQLHADQVKPPIRDTVEGLIDQGSIPAIVSISDIHGYLNEARSALLTLRDHSEYLPVVDTDSDGTLHWADNNYVLVFNGDLIDRGPHSQQVLEMAARLLEEAPPGRVRVTLGNHEAILLLRDTYGFNQWYAGTVSTEERRYLLEWISRGHLVAAYDGHSVTYAHAGAPDTYDVGEINNSLEAAAKTLKTAAGSRDDIDTQRQVKTDHPQVLGTATDSRQGAGHGTLSPKGPGAGLAWLDWAHLPGDAPPQVVGHTRHKEPQQNGNVYCQNVIQDTRESAGGEAVFVEQANDIRALIRTKDGGVTTRRFD